MPRPVFCGRSAGCGCPHRRLQPANCMGYRTSCGARDRKRYLGQHRTIPAMRLKHRSGSCGTASALPKCSIMSGCGTRIVLRGQKPLALCDRCPCFGSLFPPLAALTFVASSIICAFGLASAVPRSPYRHLELCGIALGCIRKVENIAYFYKHSTITEGSFSDDLCCNRWPVRGGQIQPCQTPALLRIWALPM